MPRSSRSECFRYEVRHQLSGGLTVIAAGLLLGIVISAVAIGRYFIKGDAQASIVAGSLGWLISLMLIGAVWRVDGIFDRRRIFRQAYATAKLFHPEQ